MNKRDLSQNQLGSRVCRLAVIALAATLLSGCFYTKLVRGIAKEGSYAAAVPWWCKGVPGTTTLTEEECAVFSFNALDVAVWQANKYATVGALPAAAFKSLQAPPGTGVAYVLSPTLPTSYSGSSPNVLLYDGDTPDSRLVGMAWLIDSETRPATPTDRDDDFWSEVAPGNWWLNAWAIRGYENHANIFAQSHPCLDAAGAIPHDTQHACFTSTHTEPLEIVISNDDGFSAEGIDAIVEALIADPDLDVTILPSPAGTASAGTGQPIEVTIVAPLGERSGSSDNTTPGGATTAYEYSDDPSTYVTASGEPVTAVDGFPADSVIWALSPDRKSIPADLVISGINSGQNFGILSNVSGTVGAARTGRRQGVAAIATSQGGITVAPQFDDGAADTLALLEQWRLGKTVNTTKSVLSINIPSCPGDDPRGRLETIVSQRPNTGNIYLQQDCTSTKPAGDIIDDLDAFNNGFSSVTDVGSQQPPNW